MKQNFTYKDINNMVLESVKRILKESSVVFYVVDDGGTYNVLSSDMFDANGKYIENRNYSIEDFDIIKTTSNEQMAWKLAEKLNREYQEEYGDFSPSKGYYNESKTTQITESTLQRLITEGINEVFDEFEDEGSDYDNMTNDAIKKLEGNFYEVIVPDWALPALVNGDYEGLDDEEIRDVQAFEKNFEPNGPCPLANGLNAGDCCVPLDGKTPSFYSKNDLNGKGADCYKFALPAK